MLSPYPFQKTRGANAFRMPRYLGKTYIVDILETMTSQARRRQPWIRGSQKPWDIAESPPPAPLPKHALLGRCCWHPPWPANRHLSIKTRTWIWCWEVINLELNCWTWRSRRSREIWEISCGKNLVKALKGNPNYDGMSKSFMANRRIVSIQNWSAPVPKSNLCVGHLCSAAQSRPWPPTRHVPS